MKNMYIRIPEELHARVKARAERDGISMNQIAVHSIRYFLESITVMAVIEQQLEGEVTLTFDGQQLELMSDLLDKYKETRNQWGLTETLKDG